MTASDSTPTTVEAAPAAPAGSATVRLDEPPSPATDAPGASRELLHALRRFHRGDPGAPAGLVPPGEGFVPVLLAPLRDPERVRHDYPLFLPDPGAADEDLTVPLGALLPRLVATFAPGGDDARALRDNLARLERGVRDALDGIDAPVDAKTVLAGAARDMQEALALRPKSAAALDADLESLIAAVPEGGRLLALSEEAPLHLFALAARSRARARDDALRGEARRLRDEIGERLRLDRTKLAADDGSGPLCASVGATAAAHFDQEALARMLGSTAGPQGVDPEHAALERVYDTLDRFLAAGPPPLVTVVSGAKLDARLLDVDWHVVAPAEICRAACELFDERAAGAAKLLGAIRAARLLAHGAYEPRRHGPLLDAFDWHAFTPEEIRRVPPVLAVASADELAGAAMVDLSRLLRSGRAVEVIVPVPPAASPGRRVAHAVAERRLELAYLGISHREALVHQSSAARPDHLVRGFCTSLDAASPSLHIVTSGLTADGGVPPLGAWQHAGAALEGRAHPFIHYNPEAGATWARRIDFTGNPQPDRDWPVYELIVRTGDDEESSRAMAFTFADFALLEPGFREHYRVIPPALASDELVPIDAYLALPAETAADRLPYVWAADEQGVGHRLLISRELVFACRDRLDYWRTLQELAGVRNEHVREAVARERERLEAAFDAERAREAAGHADALAAAGREAAQAAMGRIAQALLAGDLDRTAARAVAGARTAAPPAAGADADADTDADAHTDADADADAGTDAHPDTGAGTDAAAPAPTPTDDEPEEPWIDTILCTSCNDCLDINPQMFVYNGNKQAVIGDPRAGTFAQLVLAAEKCPARCIHPGRPLDPDEPNLDALVGRAKEFN